MEIFSLNKAEATKAENQAFEYIRLKEWCKATNAFLDAWDHEKVDAYIYNAAKAAEYAKDRKLALTLSIELLGEFPDYNKQQEINELIKKLTDDITAQGSGTKCIRVSSLQVESQEPPAPAPTPPPQENPATDPKAKTPEPPQTLPKVSPPPPVIQETREDGKLNFPLALQWGGAALFFAGGTVSGFGLTHYFAVMEQTNNYNEKVTVFNSDETVKNAQNVVVAIEGYDQALAGWQNDGQPQTLLGLTLIGFGAGSVVAGWLLERSLEPEESP